MSFSFVGCLNSKENNKELLSLPSLNPKKIGTEIKNKCMFEWATFGKSKKYLVGKVHVIVDLKNSDGQIEERAFINIKCQGKYNAKSRSMSSSQCAGVKISGLDETFVNSYSTNIIFPEDIEIISKPGHLEIELKWEDNSIFRVINGSEFSWVMPSKLSGRTHKGSVRCSGN